MSGDDAYRTTPRLPGEPVGSFETRASIGRLHKRIDDGNERREDMLTILGRIEGDLKSALRRIDELDERTDDKDGHGKRLRTLEGGAAKNSGIALVIGAVGGFLTRFIYPHP